MILESLPDVLFVELKHGRHHCICHGVWSTPFEHLLRVRVCARVRQGQVAHGMGWGLELWVKARFRIQKGLTACWCLASQSLRVGRRLLTNCTRKGVSPGQGRKEAGQERRPMQAHAHGAQEMGNEKMRGRHSGGGMMEDC